MQKNEHKELTLQGSCNGKRYPDATVLENATWNPRERKMLARML